MNGRRSDMLLRVSGAAALGQVFGSYRLVRLIGRGGMGSVYEARHVTLDKAVAIKFINADVSQEAGSRFFAEAKAAAGIHHPGIVDVLDFAVAPDGSAYMVMELLRGEGLGRLLLRSGRLPVAAAVAIAVEVAGVLEAAHHTGVIHRDLKPDNIYLEPAEGTALGRRVKILDFGIAKIRQSAGVESTQVGLMLGTPLYLSPEQARGRGQIDQRTDIYALGGVLFEMLCGQAPSPSAGRWSRRSTPRWRSHRRRRAR